MNKTNELKTATQLVKYVLETDKKARNSDSYLYLKVIERQAIEKGIDIRRIALENFLLYSSEWGFIPFETVRRTRQKIQRAFPLLRACPAVEQFRSENEKEFRDFARA